MSTREQLEKLYFHDSCFREIHILFSDGNARSCQIDIDYYNWEGNENIPENEPWRWKRLLLNIGYLAHFEYSAPDVINRAQDIDDIELDYNLDKYKEKRGKKHCRLNLTPIIVMTIHQVIFG